MIPVGTSGVSYCCLAFSRPLVSQPGRNAAEKPMWMLKAAVWGAHRVGKGYRQGLAVPLQGLAGCLLLLQERYSAHCGYGQGGLWEHVCSKVPLASTFSEYP